MQGQRGSIGSSPETLNFDHGYFDHGSSSSHTAVDQQIHWNNMQNTAENIMPDYLLSPGDMNIAYMNSMSHGQQSMSRWSFGEPSSNLSLDDVNLNPMFTQSSNSDAIVQNLNLNARFGNRAVDNNQVIDCPNIHKSAGSESVHIPSSSGSDSFYLPSRSGGILADLHHDRPGSSMEGHRTSCKRKALEENVAQSSIGGSSYSRSSSLSISAPPEQVNSRLRLGAREVTSSNISDSSNGESPESSHRNFRIRLNSSNQQDSISPTLLSTGSAFRHPGASSSQMPPRLPPIDHPLVLSSMPAMDNTVPQSQSQPVMMHVPALAQSVQSFRWNGGSKSRNGNSLSSVGDRHMTRSILEHPTFLPPTDMRNLGQNPINRSLEGGNTSVHGSTTSTSRTRPSLGVPLPSVPWLPHENSHPPQHPRRVAEYVRRQLFSVSGIETGGQTGNYARLNSGPASSQDMVHPSGGGSLAHHSLHPRPAWMERHGDGTLGIPYALRTLAAASEGSGSNRLVSEMRNVLGIMRRGEGLRFEDVMILDHSVLFGVADIHDRHRDMRLDVDNMSYEELLALEERIGNVSTGLSEETIVTFLKQHMYSNGPESQFKTEPEPCCICQEEYNVGDGLGKLECGHDFHTDCIKQWLMQKNLCPICKTTALETT